jgi:YbgC/YbaW family acyl-CoA thioester hydrolase
VNLFVRFLWLFIAARRRPPVPVLGPCRTPFRVLPTDLDVLRHVNNGVYLSLMDLARLDLMVRAGLAPKARAHGWYPVVVGVSVSFRRSLTLLQRFEIETRVMTWDNRTFLVEQVFFRGPEPIAHALVRARFLARDSSRVTPADVLSLVGVEESPPQAPEWAARWNTDQSTWHLEGR